MARLRRRERRFTGAGGVPIDSVRVRDFGVSRASGARLAGSALLVVAICATSVPAHANGASPYLPLNLSPEIERKVEQVMILADQPVLTRPIPIARVLTALPRACQRDANLCAQVRRYLDRYFETFAVTEGSLEVGGGTKSTLQIPNSRGQRLDSNVAASVSASLRPFTYVLLTGAGTGYNGTDGRFTPDGSMISLGGQYLQVDAGFRDQWLSPLTDSSTLISTEAPAMPGVTLSNQLPIGPLGFEYQFSVARMSYSDLIVWNGHYTAGNPNLATLHLGFNPLPGWSIAGNAVEEYGGGDRPSGLGNLFTSFFKRTVFASGSGNLTDTRFANRELSFTSSYTFPGKTPLVTYVEYAGRDTLHGQLDRLHETSLSAGIHIPELFGRYDLTLEASERQNNWYTDYVWQSGMVEDGSVIGAWDADWRNFYNASGARSALAQLGFALSPDDLINLRYRVVQNAGYAYLYQAAAGYPPIGYSLAEIGTVEYAQLRNGYTRGVTLDAGRDEFAKAFVRLGLFLRLDGGNQGGANASSVEAEPDEEQQGQPAASQLGFERFVDVGGSGGRLGLNLGGFSAASESAPLQYQTVWFSVHLGAGLRRAITTHQDIGVRLDIDDFKGLTLGLRIMDYRYRIGQHLALGGFAGFARFSGPTPAQGYYFGAGGQWRNLWHHWDLSLEDRFYNSLQRDKLLPSDQAAAQNGDVVEWYSLQAPTLYFSHDF